jgi:shikimate kinase
VRRTVVLIGMMGSGKTSVGRELARLLGLPWMDLDQALEQRHKASVAEQFESHGEAAFRRRERDLLKELCAAAPCVLSAGGGVVLDPANRARLKKVLTVYLKVSPEVLASRLQGPGLRSRPLLKAAQGGAVRVLKKLARGRAPLYRSSARITVLAAQGSAKAVAQRIQRRLASQA